MVSTHAIIAAAAGRICLQNSSNLEFHFQYVSNPRVAMPQNCHLVRSVIKTTAQGARSNSTQFYAKLINLPNTTSVSGRKNHIKIQRHATIPDYGTKSFTFTASSLNTAIMYICNANSPANRTVHTK